MKHLFIINPAAGSSDRTGYYRQEIDKVCGDKNMDYRIEVSQKPGDCTAIAREAAQSGEEYRIYSCGGDGTLNEIVTGIVGYPNVAVTCFCGGSGNDFVKIFNETEPFYHLEDLLNCKEAEFDLMRCDDHYSLNICSVGLDARIGTDVIKYKRLPLLGGFRAYVASTVVNVIRRIAEHYVIEINGQRIDGEKTMICVCNGRFYGGGFNPVPEADPTDGMLEVLVVEKVSRLQVAGVVGKYKNGHYKELPQIVKHYRTDRVRILCDKATSISLDGEQRMGQDIRISVAKEKIRFFYPENLTWKK